MLSPMLYSHNHVARHMVMEVYKFTNVSIAVGRISDGNKEVCRNAVGLLFEWCHNNNLALLVS